MNFISYFHVHVPFMPSWDNQITVLGETITNHQDLIRIMSTDNEQINIKISIYVFCAFKLREQSLSSV